MRASYSWLSEHHVAMSRVVTDVLPTEASCCYALWTYFLRALYGEYIIIFKPQLSDLQKKTDQGEHCPSLPLTVLQPEVKETVINFHSLFTVTIFRFRSTVVGDYVAS